MTSLIAAERHAFPPRARDGRGPLHAPGWLVRAGLTIATVGLAAASALGVARGFWPLLLPLAGVAGMSLMLLGPAAGLVVGLLTTPLTHQPVVPAVRLNFQDVTVVLLALGFVDMAVRHRWPGRLRPTLADGVVLFFFGWIGLSMLATGSVPSDLRIYQRLSIFPAAMYLAGRWAFSGQHRDVWLWTAVASGVVATMMLWIEYAVGDPLFVEESAYLWLEDGFRAGSMLNGPNFASAYLGLGVAAVLPLVTLKTWPGRTAAALMVLMPTALFTTQSLSGGIALLMAIGFYSFARGNVATRVTVCIAALVLLSPPVRDAISEQPWFALHSTSIQGRYDLLETANVAAQYFTNRDPIWLLIGAGYNTELKIGAQFGVGSVFRFALPGEAGESLHNTGLALAFESGLPTSLAFYSLLLLTLWVAWEQRHDRLRLAGGMAAVIVLIASSSNTISSIPQVLGFALFLMAATHTPPSPATMEARR